jgi:hypothetical protein
MVRERREGIERGGKVSEEVSASDAIFFFSLSVLCCEVKRGGGGFRSDFVEEGNEEDRWMKIGGWECWTVELELEFCSL